MFTTFKAINEEKTAVVLYDMSILDIDERREKRLSFESISKAGYFLGHKPQTISLRMKHGHYVYHRENRTKYAIRKA